MSSINTMAENTVNKAVIISYKVYWFSTGLIHTELNEISGLAS